MILNMSVFIKQKHKDSSCIAFFPVRTEINFRQSEKDVFIYLFLPHAGFDMMLYFGERGFPLSFSPNFSKWDLNLNRNCMYPCKIQVFPRDLKTLQTEVWTFFVLPKLQKNTTLLDLWCRKPKRL